MPIYNTPAASKDITLTINNSILKLTESYIKDSNEPILIYIYDYITPPNTIIKVNVSIINRHYQIYFIVFIENIEK